MSELDLTDYPEQRGHCRACRHWQAEHDGPAAEDKAVGLCMHAELTHFSLQVSGVSGCNRFETVIAEPGMMEAAVRGAGGIFTPPHCRPAKCTLSSHQSAAATRRRTVQTGEHLIQSG